MRIHVDPPASDDVSRERVERQMFAQLGAIRGIERAESIAPLRPRTRWLPAAAFAGVAAVLVMLVIVAMRGGDSTPATRDPVITHHVVPPGGASRWTSGDATIEAFSDTAVEQRSDHQGITLTLARGKVDCDVEPRPGRLPFRVIAGDVAVEVVGTRFAVQRTATGVRVDVSRGKVRVTSPSGESLLTVGGAWSSEPAITAQAPPPPPPSVDVDQTQIDLEPSETKPAKPKPASGKEAFEQATKLERRDPAASARMYRAAATGADRTYAALALYSLAELERRRGGSATALKIIDQYLRRFPRGANVEELVWLRVDIYRAAKQTTDMNDAARDYLRRFPSGTYAKPAQGLARPR